MDADGKASHKRSLTGGSPSTRLKSTSQTPASPPVRSMPKKRRVGSIKTPADIAGSQKSHFEREVLEKLTDTIEDSRELGSERSMDQRWDRPAVPEYDPLSDEICFQQIDVESGFTNSGEIAIQIYGITENRNSVLLHVTGFQHYLYVLAPSNFSEHDIPAFKGYLNSEIERGSVSSVSIEMKESIYGFQGNQKSPYLKITVTEPRYFPKLRSLFEHRGVGFKGLWGNVEGGIMTFDNIQYALRFMVDSKMVGMSWLEIAGGNYEVVNDYDRISDCQIEIRADWKDVVAHPAEGKWAKIAPLRILSLDIECAGRKGIFPEPEVDPVIQIANIVSEYGQETPIIRNVFCLGTCNPITNAQVIESKTESEMLMKWQAFLKRVDPDILIGYNTSNFDFPYLLNRAKHLRLRKFPYWTRLTNKETELKEGNLQSKQMGNRGIMETSTEGRLQLDILQCVQRDYNLRSYTLNSVSAHFLNEQKEDVHHSIITELQEGDADTRRRLAVYCLKDAYLPQRLLNKLMFLVNYTEMARVTGVPFGMLLSRGQQIKFLSQLFRKALDQDLVIPNLQGESGDDNYEGATVIEPNRGYYKMPIATLDFASLYPSIIQAHNLCYTTLLNQQAVDRLKLVKDEDYVVTPNNDMFCTTKVRKGLLSQIFEELLGARKKAKRDLAVEKDPFKQAVLNGRQLALKISANSVYGLTGASNGRLPCLAIASSTTSYGRQMIEKTKKEVEERYTIANGYSHDAKVIYGDTDSVMVRFGTSDLKEAMKLGEEAASYVSSKFTRPIKLEFEKVYFPYLLINKKRYAGLYWTNPDKWDKMDTKGIETVRRDNCRLVQNVIENSLKMLLIEQDPEGAEEFVKSTISSLLQNKIDLSELVITKALSKKDYEGKQAHTVLAERMRKRDAGSAPSLGDRVAYVIIKGATGAKNYEKSEDPLYVLENNIPIDTKYYLDNQLAKPLGRIFEPTLGTRRAAQLLSGEHTRTISVASSSAAGGLMKFAKRVSTCLGCKKPLSSAAERDGAVCDQCAHRLPELYCKSLTKAAELEVRFSRLWTQCQRCQGSMHSTVICSSRDCPIFYMRMKARKDVEEASRELVRFENDESLW